MIKNLENLLEESQKQEENLLEEAEKRGKKGRPDEDLTNQEESSELRKKIEKYKLAYGALEKENAKLRQEAANWARTNGGTESDHHELRSSDI